MAAKSKKKVYATHVTAPDGTRVYIRGRDKAELQIKVAEARLAMGAGVDLKNNTTFKEFAQMWMDVYKKNKVRPTTYATYSDYLRLYLNPVFGTMKLRDIKPVTIQQFLSSISHLSHPVQRHIFQTLKSILDCAVDNGILTKTPVRKEDKVSGKPTEEVPALTNDQCVQLLSAVRDTRAYLFCLLVLSTGLRKGEALGLMWEDIDFSNGTITVQHNKVFPNGAADAPVTDDLKTTSAYRTIPIPNLLIRVLMTEKMATTSPYVLHTEHGESLGRNSFNSMWSMVNRRVDFHVHPHQLRHTYITNLFVNGADIKEAQYLAGHSKPDITLAIYTHYQESQRKEETRNKVIAATDFLEASNG